MPADPLAPARAVAEGLLARIPGRKTAIRTTVLASLLTQGRSATHTDLHRLAPDLDRVSLYRTLDWLVAQGLARRVTDSDGVWRFEPVVPGSNHHHPHFECTRCHQTTCIETAGRIEVHLPTGFRQDDITVLVRGLCRTCGLLEVPRLRPSATPSPARGKSRRGSA